MISRTMLHPTAQETPQLIAQTEIQVVINRLLSASFVEVEAGWRKIQTITAPVIAPAIATSMRSLMIGAWIAVGGANKSSNVEPSVQPMAFPNTHQPAFVRHCFNINHCAVPNTIPRAIK